MKFKIQEKPTLRFKSQSTVVSEPPKNKFKIQNVNRPARADWAISKILEAGIGKTSQNFRGWNVDETLYRSSSMCIVAGFFNIDSFDYIRGFKQIERYKPELSPTSKLFIHCGKCSLIHNICYMLCHWNYDHKLSRENQIKRLQKRGF